MSAVHFSGSSSATDRRRRRLVTEIDPAFDLPDTTNEAALLDSDAEIAPFPMLSRDRLIRRVISPRLWKHVTVAVVLILTPIIYAVVNLRLVDQSSIAEQVQSAGRLDALRGLSGLELFLAAQFCLVIAWVRSASAVDFRGGYRWWRWMAIGLFAASLLLLTNVTPWITDLIALGLEPIFGRIDAARPALILVPAGACLALVLHRLIPDMGRCRAAQSLLMISYCSWPCAFAGARQNSVSVVFHLSVFEFLISALVLSAFQLHARFVIHVNPHPPLAVQRKPAAVHVQDRESTAVEAATAQIVDPQPEAVLIPESSDAGSTGETALTVSEQPRIDHEEITRTAPKAASPIAAQPQANGKNGKKQKYRKAG
ncbi:MAG: hypothetical protein WKF77_01655 [Planctomycetaceae bacterium]